MPTSICPECTEEVFVDAECELGDNVNCEECGSRLVVVGLDPVELDLEEESIEDGKPDRDDLDTYDFEDDRY